MTQTVDDDITRLTDDELLALVHTRARRLDRQIRFRDWRELVAGIIAGVIIAPAATRGPILGRVGALIILGGLLLVAVRLWRARHVSAARADDVALPVAAALRAELQRVDAQIALLANVALWYVAPLIGGSLILVAATTPLARWRFTLGYTVMALLLAWAIVMLNRRAVRGNLQPMRDDIAALLAQIES